jgi:hypothetical protein
MDSFLKRHLEYRKLYRMAFGFSKISRRQSSTENDVIQHAEML